MAENIGVCPKCKNAPLMDSKFLRRIFCYSDCGFKLDYDDDAIGEYRGL